MQALTGRQALTLLDYCLHAGSENVVIYFKDNIYIIKWVSDALSYRDSGREPAQDS